MSTRNRVSAVPYYGGKVRQLDHILPLLPRDRGNWHYVDVFGGSASVLLNIVPPFRLETYNDLESEVVTFFRVLRDDPDELVRRLQLTPFARDELDAARHPDTPLQDDMERARRFYVRATMTINSLTKISRCAGMRMNMALDGGSARYASAKSAANSWNLRVEPLRGSGGSITANRVSGVDTKLHRVARRLHAVQIENREALHVIRQYDRPHTIFYIDPPYVRDTRLSKNEYEHEYSDSQHRELAAALNGIAGRAIVSGYQSDLYDELYAGWHQVSYDVKAYASVNFLVEGSGKSALRTETIWMNYVPDAGPPLLDELDCA